MRRFLVALALVLGLSTYSYGGVGRLDLSWTDNSDNEDGFKIERKGGDCTSPGIFIQIDQVGPNVTTYGNLNLPPGSTYAYRVRAYNAAGNSGYSNCASGTTAPAPNAATNLSVN